MFRRRIIEEAVCLLLVTQINVLCFHIAEWVTGPWPEVCSWDADHIKHHTEVGVVFVPIHSSIASCLLFLTVSSFLSSKSINLISPYSRCEACCAVAVCSHCSGYRLWNLRYSQTAETTCESMCQKGLRQSGWHSWHGRYRREGRFLSLLEVQEVPVLWRVTQPAQPDHWWQCGTTYRQEGKVSDRMTHWCKWIGSDYFNK